MKQRRAVAAGAVAAMVLGAACGLLGPNYHELTLKDGAVVTGSNRGVSWRPTEFFSVRVEESFPGVALRSTARLHLRGRELELRTLTPADVQALGIEARRPFDGDEQWASVGYGEQNRVGSVEFKFAGGRLREFYARCHESAGCDFELSWPDRPRFKLPIQEERVESVLAPVASVRDFYGP
jgi:hypothetical protein